VRHLEKFRKFFFAFRAEDFLEFIDTSRPGSEVLEDLCAARPFFDQRGRLRFDEFFGFFARGEFAPGEQQSKRVDPRDVGVSAS